jgi:acyl-CoA synthetase (NDP forming)
MDGLRNGSKGSRRPRLSGRNRLLGACMRPCCADRPKRSVIAPCFDFATRLAQNTRRSAAAHGRIAPFSTSAVRRDVPAAASLSASQGARMNFHEYQAKELFAQYGIPVPAGKVAATPETAAEAARALGGEQWVVKAQIHAGGRGKAGGVKLCKTPDEVKAAAAGMLGKGMTTYQSGGRALPVNVVLVSEANDIAKELYLSVLVDRGAKAVAFIGSARGGVDIEQVARENPEDNHTIEVDFVEGLQP